MVFVSVQVAYFLCLLTVVLDSFDPTVDLGSCIGHAKVP